jgi:hypothetical protein
MSFDEYVRLERIEHEATRAISNFSTALFFAVPLVPVGALAAFGTSDGQASWFYLACLIAGAIAMYGFGQKAKADRLMDELGRAGFFLPSR